MALNGQVAAAGPGLLGYDTQIPLDAVAAAAAAARYSFCIRYVSRTQTLRDGHARDGTADLSQDEAAAILAAGMAVMAVQHPPPAGWSPTAALGSRYGQFAAECAGQAGLPAGVNIWLDLEGVAAGSAAADVIGYCNAWFGEVAASGYVPGLYVGSDCGLDGDQLFSLATRHYWKSCSRVPDVTRRSYQLVQSCLTSNGQHLDTDLTHTDRLGGQVLWLAPTKGD
jgi:hypothetical protein